MDKNASKGVSDVQRRTWDKAHYSQLAERRANGQAVEETRAKTKLIRGNRVEFEAAQDAAIASADGRAYLKARNKRLLLDNDIGKVQIVQSHAQDSANKRISGTGYYCDVCECSLKDSVAYLDHCNGKLHLHRLGFSMRVERSTVSQVKSRLRSAIEKKWEPLLGKQSIPKPSPDKEQRKKRRTEKPTPTSQHASEETAIAEAMGFGSFSTSKK